MAAEKTVNTFMASDLTIAEDVVRNIKPESIRDYVFGRTFTDHMLICDWTKADGWGKPNIVPYGPMKIATSATSLHYGIACHVGLSIVPNSSTGKL